MNQEEFSLLKKTYDEKHGLQPNNDYDSIRRLHGIYRTVMGVEVLTQDEKDGIGDYYRRIKAKNEPAYYWILDAIHMTSRKKASKRRYEYMIGILKHWQKYGYGFSPSDEEAEIVNYFEEATGSVVPDSIRHIMHELMISYGAIAVTRMIGSIRDYDKSYAFALLLRELLTDRYGHKQNICSSNPLAESNNALVAVADNQDSEQEVEKPKRSAGLSRRNQMKVEAEIVELFLKEQKAPTRLNAVFEYMKRYGVHADKNKARTMSLYMQHVPNIIKAEEYGCYMLKEYNITKNKAI